MKTAEKALDELRKILNLGSYFPLLRRIKDGFEIELDCPSSLSFAQLEGLSKFFGTNRIDVNGDIERGGGCDTCAYEKALLKIQVYEATQHFPEFDKKGFGRLAC